MSIHKIKLKSGGYSYKVYIRGVGTKQRTKTFKRKVDAEKWEREQLHKLEHPELEPKKQNEMLFQELVGYWDDNHATVQVAKSTHKRYWQLLNKYILPIFGHQQVESLQTIDIDQWFAQLQKKTKLSSKTLNHILNLLRGILNWGVQRFRFPFNPCDPVKVLQIEPSRFVFWDEEEVERFLFVNSDDPYFPVYTMALNTGMRLGELAGLQWDCVDLERRLIRITRTWCSTTMQLKNTTKGRKARIVPIHDTLYQVLAEVKLKGCSPWVLTRPDGERLDSEHLTWRHFKPACQKAGVRVIRFHDTRHTFASHFMMRGGNIYDLQKILGHASIQTTEIYSHLSPEHLQDAVSIVQFGTKKNGVVLPMQNHLQRKVQGQR